MSQPVTRCMICHERPAVRKMKMYMSTRLTGYYVVVTTYQEHYVVFPVCEEDYGKITRSQRRRGLGIAGMALGTIAAVPSCALAFLSFAGNDL